MKFFRRRKEMPTNAEYGKMNAVSAYPEPDDALIAMYRAMDRWYGEMREFMPIMRALEHRIKVVETHRPAVDALIESNRALTKQLNWLEKRVDEHYAILQHISHNCETRYRELEKKLAWKVDKEEE